MKVVGNDDKQAYNTGSICYASESWHPFFSLEKAGCQLKACWYDRENPYLQFIKNLITFLCLLFISSFAYALSPAEELSTELNKIQSMQAKFTQTIYDNHDKPVQQAQGKMALQRPGKFRWEMTTPTPQLIITNQNKMWIYDPDLEQVTIRSLQKATGSTPAFLLSQNNSNLDKEYLIRKENGAYELIPRQENEMFGSLKIILSQGQITDLFFRDHLDHTTKIHFTAIHNNPALSNQLFTFTPPKNVDVIDETKR